LLLHPALAFGEAYTAGRVSVDHLSAFLESTNRALAGRPYQWHAPRFPRISRRASADNVHAHYDLGNDFYRLWLDDAMVYTCAYFERPDATLEQAQRAKLDLVCRKLRLKPGERVIEAGCGWGALAIHMAREYGVLVRAFNISRPQLEYARKRAAAAGVSDRVSFIESDYRSIDGRCDAFVSVGMLEHVGRRQYAELGGIIARALDGRHGRALVHFIGRNRPMPMNSWIARHVFPGAYAPALGEVLPGLCETVDLSVLDVENLRLHYAQTIRHWRARFERHAAVIAECYDEAFVRTWRLYLAGAEASFVTGDLQLFQVTLARATDNDVPWTREAIYRSAHAHV
jgi:cyclopropane-fatty-acyl-phospholipid synthase